MSLDVIFKPNLYCYDFESITVDNTIKQLDATKRASACKVYMRLETAPIRYRADGGDPSSDGSILLPMESKSLDSPADIVNFRVTRDGAVNGTLKVEFFKEIT